MSNIVLVGIGGFIGSIMRYLASGWVQQITQSVEFPYGTLVVNLIGCFVIGFLAELADARGVFNTEARTFVFVGVLGGFTTFSSFSNETMNLLRDGEMFPALANVSAHIVLGLSAVWLGRIVAHTIWR